MFCDVHSKHAIGLMYCTPFQLPDGILHSLQGHMFRQWLSLVYSCLQTHLVSLFDFAVFVTALGASGTLPLALHSFMKHPTLRVQDVNVAVPATAC